MPWQLTYTQDTEIPGVGTATASYADDAGNVNVTHSGRIDNRDGATISEFIDAALAKYARRQKIDADTVPLLAKIQAVLDSKVKQ